jgi:tetratricopeptide (TPR) repeat protein
MRTVFLRVAALALTTCAAAPLLAGQASPAPAPAATAPAPIPVLTAEQWQADLDFMAAEMERRHKNLFHTVSREAFQAAVLDLRARIPTLQRHQIIAGMMRIAAMVRDGHSRVDPRKDVKFGMPSLPVKLYLFEDGLFVRAGLPEHAKLLGAKVEAIGGVPVAEAMRRAGTLASRDNEVGVKLFVPLYLAMPQLLHALELSKSPETATLTLSRGGKRWTVTLPAHAVDPIWPPDTDISLVTPEGWVDARKTPALPLWVQAPLDYHRLVELPEHKALYAQMNMVTNVEGQTVPQYARKIAERVAATNPKALILDLRLNLGGNGNLRTELVRTLIRAEDEDTKLFVLTWRGTFSASQFILDDLDRLSGAIFIGEPASSKPSSYGDAYRKLMPNSGIAVRSSIVWWQEGQNFDPWTPIDIATPYRFADYEAGRDPALEAALAWTPRPPLHERLLAHAKAGGAEAVIAGYEAYRADPVNRYANVAGRTTGAAEHLLNSGEVPAALALARRAAADFREKLDAHMILAFVAERAGDKALALGAARRALEIDPNNRFILPLLARVEAP